ncbi:MIGE-like protein [Chrysochromulina ericina virus CeV-01B]|uniref:MIGE-like protein n=1 Tax=Chrysochromulina ericina virus CeV-01B TaxID=3070830 RepID=A0A0N9R361_9VIRU|nr:MIGE-like protein [Chrysochromulina ericina virus]ALH22928.1 MIGE-like protein [Chrysochromulina ericina virus CeV-01B]|tara:strand:+ start:32 stop:958 length:927 start_codon:yes stop_codon:yes gene_type:complete
MAKKISENLAKFYICENCNYKSKNKSDYNIHCLTIKHKRLTNAKNTNVISENLAKNEYICCCGKIYKHQSSLSKHKKLCNYNKEEQIIESNENKDELKSLIIKIMTDNSEKMNFLMNENKELRNQLKEQNQQITELIPKVGNNNNTLKQKFNINVFLNEKCKDALSMDEFIEKIEISMKDLLTTREKGQVQGISNIIIENINKLSLYERPLHCTDKKRETLYIKNHEWEKDDNREYIGKALKKVESKQLKNIKIWLDKHPDYMNIPEQQEEFAKLISECGKSVDEYGEKVIKKLCDNVYIEKIYDNAL